MPSWPASLQERMNKDFSESYDPGVIRTNMDEGPAKVRRRFTKILKRWQAKFWMDATDYDTFMNFYNIDIEGGVLSFDWVHPITLAPQTYRFYQPPTLTPIGPLTWQINMELEELP